MFGSIDGGRLFIWAISQISSIQFQSLPITMRKRVSLLNKALQKYHCIVVNDMNDECKSVTYNLDSIGWFQKIISIFSLSIE